MANEGKAYGISRYGENLGSGAEEALFLKLWSGEVLTAFERYSVTNGRVRERRIQNGKSAQFPLVGAMSSSYLTPGENLITEGGSSPDYLQDPKLSEKVIAIDGLLTSSVMISDIDEAMAHYDVRGPFAREMGWALAKTYDLNNLWAIWSGSLDAATITDDESDWGKGGKARTNAAWVAEMTDEILAVARVFDQNDVPSEGRHMVLDPTDFYTLLGKDKVINADYANQGGGTGGSSARGGGVETVMFAGMNIHKSNRLVDFRTFAHSGETPLGTDYDATSRANVKMLAWQEDQSVGVVKLKDLTMQSEYKIEYQSTFMVGGFACGHGVLHESACASLITS
jgi:hypothetical protein